MLQYNMESKSDFLFKILKVPSFGYTDKYGNPIRPTIKQTVMEVISNCNVFKSKKNWFSLFNWSTNLALQGYAIYYLIHLFYWPYFLVGLFYSFLIVPPHSTLYLHRFGTHKAFKIKNRFWTYFVKHIILDYFPEELYVPSHHVHHKYADKIGDPYNVASGGAFCFFADTNQNQIRRDLSESEYKKLVGLFKHVAVPLNSYKGYLKWGSLTHPGFALLQRILNFSFWYFVFFLIGGHPLAGAIFATITFPLWGLRAFNYAGHGKGKDLRVEGDDFCRSDLSINNTRSKVFAGEWHNNHHLFPQSARAGFLPNQIDIPWFYIKGLNKLGVVTSYKDDKDRFLKEHYIPWCSKLNMEPGPNGINLR